MVIFIVDHTILPGGNTLDSLFALKAITFFVLIKQSAREFGCVPNLECHGCSILPIPIPCFISILSDEVEGFHLYCLTILGIRVVPSANEDDITFDIFLDYEPRPSTESQPFALPYRMKPVTLMSAYYFPCFQFDYPAFFLSQITFY